MSVTVADMMKLPSLQGAKIIAGRKGLTRILSSVSVLEYADPTFTQNALFDHIEFYGNEIVITAFANIKDDVDAQCNNIRRLAEAGEVGIILYYVGILMPRVDARLAALADELDFTLILMPENRMDLRYSEVICEVMEAIFQDQQSNISLVTEILERVSALAEHQRTIDTVLKMLSDRMHVSIILTGSDGRILNEAAWPRSRAGELQTLLPTLSLSGQPGTPLRKNGLLIYSYVINADYSPMNLYLFHTGKPLEQNILRQFTDVIQLSVNLWSRRHGEVATRELVRAILQDEPAKMRRLADIFHIDVASIHTMWILRARKKASEWVCEELTAELQRLLSPYSASVLIDVYEDVLVLFMDGRQSLTEEQSIRSGILNSLETRKISAVMTCCNHLEHTVDARNAFLLNQECLEDAGKIFPSQQVFQLSEIRFAQQCRDILNQGELAIREETAVLGPLLDIPEGKELLKTLSTYLLDAQSGITRTAARLFVHKNTIKYRLQRCSESCGFHIGHQPETMALYRAAALCRLIS